MQDAPATGIIWAHWRDIVGPQIADHAEPSSLKDGVLRIRTDSPTWATEIGYLGADIAAAANLETGRKMVERVVVWIGPKASPSSASTNGVPSPERARRLRPASDDPREAFEAARRAWLKHRGRPSS